MKHVRMALCVLLVLCGAAGYANSWTILPSMPDSVFEGGALAYGSFPLSSNLDTIYAMVGANPFDSRRFYRFDISQNNWQRIADLPVDVLSAHGGAMTFAPAPHGYEAIYALAGENNLCRFIHIGTAGFYEGTWYTFPADSLRHFAGCAITWGGTGEEGGIAGAYLYAFVGGSNQYFRKYWFTTPPRGGIPLTRWRHKADFGTNVNHGALTYNSQWINHESVIYGLGNSNNTKFRGYNPDENSWAELDRPWSSHGPGTALAAKTIGGANDTMYALRGGGSSNFRRYRVSLNDWTRRAATEWDIGQGAGLAFCPHDRLFYATRGDRTGNFARYNPYSGFGDDSDGLDGGQTAAGTPAPRSEVVCRPSGRGTYLLSYPAAVGIEVTFSVHDATGRRLTQFKTRQGQVEWSPQNAGVFMVAVSGPGLTATGRLTALQ